MNSFGQLFRVTVFGESHGPAIGAVIDGCPAGFELNSEAIQEMLDRRRPGGNAMGTARNEADQIEILSGLSNGMTIGSPIAFIIRNRDTRSQDYNSLKEVFRPSHADFTYEAKYGLREQSGGGRSSARLTAPLVVAGAIAKQLLASKNIHCYAYITAIGNTRWKTPIEWTTDEKTALAHLAKTNWQSAKIPCPNESAKLAMQNCIEEIAQAGDTIGGEISFYACGMPAGLGAPLANKLSAQLAHAMSSINAVHGFEFGSGFAGTSMKGSAHNDVFTAIDETQARTASNYSGGLQGGISNGMPIYGKVAFKPISSIRTPQQMIDSNNKLVEMTIEGRHDACPVPRAVPIVEAHLALTLLDAYLQNRNSKW
ncbi:MAG: hypothetical protein RL138_904 [Bacteroidota bacterium]